MPRSLQARGCPRKPGKKTPNTRRPRLATAAAAPSAQGGTSTILRLRCKCGAAVIGLLLAWLSCAAVPNAATARSSPPIAALPRREEPAELSKPTPATLERRLFAASPSAPRGTPKLIPVDQLEWRPRLFRSMLERLPRSSCATEFLCEPRRSFGLCGRGGSLKLGNEARRLTKMTPHCREWYNDCHI